MITHNLTQGSSQWQQFRFDYFGASEAAVMLGLSTKTKRNELLHIKHTGAPKEFSDWVQENILDYGHEVEAAARPLVEQIIGEDLYPVTCSEDKLAASCDGLTMSEEIAFEHKQWNKKLAAMVSAGEVPDEHMPQCQQVLMVTGAKKLLFVVSDGTKGNFVYATVEPSQEWFDRIRAGWEQFAKDLANYQPRELTEKPQADTILQLPALSIQISGEVILNNLPEFKRAAQTFIAKINTELTTDEDFAQAEATVKFCDKAEKELELAKKSALAQTASIDELMRTIDYIKDELKSKRLMLDKLVESKKKTIKEKIVMDARKAYAEHIASLEAEMTPIRLTFCLPPDFVEAIKNKRTLASLHDAVDTKLAGAKIAADAEAKMIRAKLSWIGENAEGYGFLFSDLQNISHKAMDDFQMVVTSRIENHRKAEEAKIQAEAERRKQAELEKMRIEQEAKDAAEKAKLAAQQAAEEARIAAIRKAEQDQRDADIWRIQAERAALETEREALRLETEAKKQEEEESKQAANCEKFSSKDPKSKITITTWQYDQLLESRNMLQALRTAGVENWEGYKRALSILEKEAA